jgi:ParB family chromosome partitioning protein
MKVKKPKTVKPQAIATRGLTLVEHLDLDPRMIGPSPYQPRDDFPAEELEALANSLKYQGQIHALAVRKASGQNGCYELLDGERRWRAGTIAGLKSLRAEVFDCTDQQARQIVLATAIHRQDLNPIEEARAYEAAIEAGDASGPTELAEQLGVSQGHVSNRIRLLDLPYWWQNKVISREISERHARAVLPYHDARDVLEALMNDLAAAIVRDELPSVAAWEKRIEVIVERVTKRMAGKEDGRKEDDHGGTEYTEVEDVTDDQDEEDLGADEDVSDTEDLVQEAGGLDEEDEAAGMDDQEEEDHPGTEYIDDAGRLVFIADGIDGSWGSFRRKPTGSLERVKSQSLPMRESVEDAISDRDAYAAKMGWKPFGQAADPQPSTLNSAPSTLDTFARDLYAWRCDWQRFLISEDLDNTSEENLLKIAVAALAHWDGNGACGRALADALASLAGRKKDQTTVEKFLDVPLIDLERISGEVLSVLFWGDSGPSELVPNRDVEAVFALLEIDMQESWEKDGQQAGTADLSDRFWDLFTNEQLTKLHKKYKLGLDVSQHDRSEIIAALLDRRGPSAGPGVPIVPFPKEIAKAKRDSFISHR